MAESENYKKGTEVRRQLMGAAHADKMNATVYDDPIMQKFGDYAREAVFGMLWTRPGLDMKTRAMITVISDTSARMNALISGQLDLMNRCDPRTISLLMKNKEIEVTRSPGGWHPVMAMQTDQAP